MSLQRLRHREEHPAASPEDIQPLEHHAFSASPRRRDGTHFTTGDGWLEIHEQKYGRIHHVQRIYLIQTMWEAVDTIPFFVQ